jgi:capsular exopolysaccharide synthesis family protein
MDNYLDQFEQDIQEKPIQWREIFEKLILNWRWFVFSAIFALILGSVYVRMQKDVFEVNSSIQIIDQTRSGQMSEMSVLKQLDAAGFSGRSSYSTMNNEEQVIKSTVLLKRVVTLLELHTNYSQRKYLKTTDLYTSSALYVRLDSVSLWRLKGGLQMTFEPKGKGFLLKGKYNNEDFELKADKLPIVLNTPAGALYVQLRDQGIAFDTELDVAINNTLPKALDAPVNTLYDRISKQDIAFDTDLDVTISNPANIALSLGNSVLSTEVGKMIDVINLKVRVSNVQKGKDILNTLADVYNQDASDQNNLSVVNTAKFIDQRLVLLTSELSEEELKVENYKQKNDLTNIDKDAEIFLDNKSTYFQQQLHVDMQKNLIDYVSEFIKDPNNKNSVIPNLGLSDPGLVQLINTYNELIITRVRLADGSSEANPALQTMNQQLAATRKAINSGIAASKKGLQITGSDLKNQNSLVQSRLRDIPRVEREFIEIKRQQQVKESLYLFLLQKREEAALSKAVYVPKGRVLNTPDFANQVAPKGNLMLLVFLFVGLIIPALVIYILELLNTNIRNRADVEKLTDIPVITELAHNKTDATFVDFENAKNTNSELFRLLRTKLQFTLDHPAEKVILVTSTMSGEGKTFASVNLAISIAMTDKKVLLMGMDLRRPQLSKHFDLHNEVGITSYLSGQEKDYNEMIYTHKNFPDLDIMPAGVIPPNPTELIMKERFATLMTALKTKYDYIIVDTAPVGAVSDTLLIDRVADITLYVTRAEYTDKRNIEFVNRLQSENSLKRIYILVNDVDVDSQRYGYNAKYGYGYGYGVEK